MKFVSLALIASVLLAVTYATPAADISPMDDDGEEYDPETILKQQKCVLDSGDEVSKKYNFVDQWNEEKKTLQNIHAAAEKCYEAKDEECQKEQDEKFRTTVFYLIKMLSATYIVDEKDLDTIMHDIYKKCIDSGSTTFQPFAASGAYFLSFYLFIQVLAYLQN